MENQYDILLRDLEILRNADLTFEVPGSRSHEYRLNPVLTEPEVGQFESLHGICLPSDYRQILLLIGNGGAGPHNGIERLGEFNGVSWDMINGLVGDVASSFPYSAKWNDSYINHDLTVEEQYEKQDRYWSPHHVNGAIPVCELGGNLRQILVISGPEEGNIWFDDRADWQGIYPLKTSNSERVSFFEWYRSWLDDSLSQINKTSS